MLLIASSSFIFPSIILIPKVVPFLSFHKQSCLLQIVDAATDSDLSPITCCWQHMARISSSSRREQEQLLRIAVAWHVARKWSRSESEARTPQGACLSQFVMKHATDRESARQLSVSSRTKMWMRQRSSTSSRRSSAPNDDAVRFASPACLAASSHHDNSWSTRAALFTFPKWKVFFLPPHLIWPTAAAATDATIQNKRNELLFRLFPLHFLFSYRKWKLVFDAIMMGRGIPAGLLVALIEGLSLSRPVWSLAVCLIWLDPLDQETRPYGGLILWSWWWSVPHTRVPGRKRAKPIIIYVGFLQSLLLWLKLWGWFIRASAAL